MNQNETPIPQSLSAERGIVGCMLCDNTIIGFVVQKVGADDFVLPAHATLFNTIVGLWNCGIKIGVDTLGEELHLHGQISVDPTRSEITFDMLASLPEPTAGSWEYYTKIVRDKAKLRRVIEEASAVLRNAYDPDGSADDIAEDAAKRMADLVEIGGDSGLKTMSQVIDLGLAQIDARAEKRGQLGVMTGFTELDRESGGLQNRELIIVAGRTSQGKSTFALGVMLNAVLRSGIVGFLVSLEQGAAEIGERILCSLGHVNSYQTRTGKLSDEAKARIMEAARAARLGNCFFDVKAGQSVARIAAHARHLRRTHEIRLVVVDYLQLIDTEEKRGKNRQEQVAAISRRLKNLAVELDIPIVALSQLNREADGERPKLSHLRESGALEQDADTVLLLHREPETPRVVTVIIAKQRNGPPGEVTLGFCPEEMRFENADQAQGISW